MTPSVALASDSNALGMQVAIEQAGKEAVDFREAEDLVACHRLAPRIVVARSETRDLPDRSNQSVAGGGIGIRTGPA